MKAKIILLLFFLVSICGFAQNKTVTGVVTSSEDSMPIPGVNVIVQGTSRGASTDFDGNFTIEVGVGEVLEFSYIGFKTKTIIIGSQNIINIVLDIDVESLNEVVLVGYGTSKKVDLTGSITRIKSDELLKQPALTPMQSLQGKAAGVQIISSGAPGSSPIVRIRGTGTVLGGRDPIYVVDGIITDRIDNINSDDILAMDILKDASSLAIYGSRGANGVIIVTTKSGKAGKMKIDASTYYGFKEVLSNVNMADASSFVNFSNIAFGTNRFSDNQQYNTDWFDVITKTGTVMNHNIAISGGNEKTTSFFSANYFEEEGILIGNEYRRLNLRNKVTYKISPKLKFEHNISLSLNRTIPKPFSAFTTAYKQSPIVPVKFLDGVFEGRYGVPFDDTGAQFNNVGNPVSQLDLSNELIKNFVIQGNVSGEYKLTDYLKFNTSFGIESSYGKSYNFNDNGAAYLAIDPTRNIGDIDFPENFSTLTVTKGDFYHWTYDAYLTFEKTLLENHNFKLAVGTTTEEEQRDLIKISRNNVPLDSDLFSLQNGDIGSEVINNNDTKLSNKKTLRSYFGRLSYDYAHKYLLTATVRRDGSSVFANRSKNWGNFASVGLGWVVSNESFFENVDFIDLLKLRASWGELGNQNIPFNAITFDSSLSTVFGNDQSIEPGSTITAIIDDNVSWEVTREVDFGIEFAVLNNRLSVDIDYYNRLNTNAILPISLPQAFGSAGATLTHAGKIRNEGVEFSLNWNDKTGNDFNYYIGGNVTYNDNVLEEITNPFAFEQSGGSIGNGQVTKLLREGQPIGSFFLLEALGLDERGEFVYNDINNDGQIDGNDRQFFGSIQADVVFGINAGFNYKSWDFNISGYGNSGSKVYNGKKAQRFGGENIEQSVANNFFSLGNTSSQNPSPSNEVPLSSTYFLEDGDFFRVNNITVGYTLPNVIDGIQKIRVYALAQNPFIFKRFTGFTPELPGNGDPLGNSGIELDAYPSVSSYLFGININF